MKANSFCVSLDKVLGFSHTCRCIELLNCDLHLSEVFPVNSLGWQMSVPRQSNVNLDCLLGYGVTHLQQIFNLNWCALC